MKTLRKTIVIGMVLFFSLLDYASGFRCGTELVSLGDAKLDVLEKCGQPDWVEEGYGPIPPELHQYGVPRNYYTGPPPQQVQRWFYNLGENRFIRILTFVQGILTRIDTGDYGY